VGAQACSLFLRVKITCHDAGDIESMPFIEALGQFSYRVGKDIVYATSYDKIVLTDLLDLIIK